MNQITTIFFDIDGTLLNQFACEKNALKIINKKYHPAIAPKEFEAVWLKHKNRNWELYEQKQLTFEQQRIKRIIDVWRMLGKSVSTKNAEKIFEKYLMYYEKYWQPFPHVLQTIKTLHKRGLTLGIISNGNKKQQIQKLKALKIYSYFNKELIIISEEFGYAKPAREIFLHAQSLVDVAPENILFIGNSPDKDIKPAKQMGWRVVLFDYSNLFPEHQSIKNFKMLSYILFS